MVDPASSAAQSYPLEVMTGDIPSLHSLLSLAVTAALIFSNIAAFSESNDGFQGLDSRESRSVSEMRLGMIRIATVMRSAVVDLGRTLYFDKRLSIDGSVSCATCHDPATAFASKDTVVIGVRSQNGTRNVPTLLNAKFSKSYFWDGRASTLEEQAKQPLLNSAEMGMESEAALVARLSSIPEYPRRLRRVFPREGITLDTVAKAIAAYERTLLSNNSPFDRFIAGDHKAISENQKTGWALFKGKAKCIDCHAHSASSPFFSDFKFYNTGVVSKDQDFENLSRRADEIRQRKTSERLDAGLLAHKPEFSDLGRFLVTDELKDIGAFKTPTLRDVELTGPYMHNGSLKTLLDVVRFYNQGGTNNPNLDQKMHPLNLSEKEMSDLVEFLRALTSNEVLRLAQTSKPQTRLPVLLPHIGAAKKRSLGP